MWPLKNVVIAVAKSKMWPFKRKKKKITLQEIHDFLQRYLWQEHNSMRASLVGDKLITEMDRPPCEESITKGTCNCGPYRHEIGPLYNYPDGLGPNNMELCFALSAINLLQQYLEDVFKSELDGYEWEPVQVLREGLKNLPKNAIGFVDKVNADGTILVRMDWKKTQ